MTNEAKPAPKVGPDGKPVKLFTHGTLTYTKPALMVLFFWLLWGDVVYTLMESVTGPIMLLKFQKLGAMNWQVGLFLTTIPSTIYAILNPIISFRSDRFRSKLGRRIPFLLFTVPVLVLLLVSLAFGDKLGFWLYHHLNLSFLSANQMMMYTLALILIVFTFFNTFVTSTFWYLFNDVVPEHVIARFMSWFRMLGTISASCYSFFIFPHSGTHSTEIFLGAAALYLIGFSLMCLNVREGKYPPPAPLVNEEKGPIAAIKTYARDCHSNKIYWYLWLCTFVGCIGGGIATFDLYFKQAIGLNLTQIGRIAGSISIIVSALILISGWLADRYGAIRVVLAGQIASWCLLIPLSFIWLFWHPAPAETWSFHLPLVGSIPFLEQFATITIQKVFLISILIYVAVAAPIMSLTSLWDPVMLMQTFPRSNYGQFCSTNAIWRTLGWMLGGVLVGLFFDYLTPIVGKERAYYFSPVWSTAFALPGFIFFILFYRQWKKLGGMHYVAPLPPVKTKAGSGSCPPPNPGEASKPVV